MAKPFTDQSLHLWILSQLMRYWRKSLHIDWPLLIGLFILISISCVLLYSAAQQDLHLLKRQLIHFGIGLIGMFLAAQIPPEKYQLWTPWLFATIISLLLIVLMLGIVSKGAQRWLNLGIIRFQPSELVKLFTPAMLAWSFSRAELPPTCKQLCLAIGWLLLPTLLIAKQPDLGTALVIWVSGWAVIFLAGIRWRILISLSGLAIVAMPIVWSLMHNYQRQRVLTFLKPEADPLGSGYHIIQSKIAIGSGGIAGKGWLQGTQSHLQFLPEHTTDFIFAVGGEEFGLLGSVVLLVAYAFVIGRCFYLATQVQGNFGRLWVGGLTFSFFFAMFVNVGMVSGLLPVVGIPLPLVSYGGSSVVACLIGCGVIMSLATHRRLLAD